MISQTPYTIFVNGRRMMLYGDTATAADNASGNGSAVQTNDARVLSLPNAAVGSAVSSVQADNASGAGSAVQTNDTRILNFPNGNVNTGTNAINATGTGSAALTNDSRVMTFTNNVNTYAGQFSGNFSAPSLMVGAGFRVTNYLFLNTNVIYPAGGAATSYFGSGTFWPYTNSFNNSYVSSGNASVYLTNISGAFKMMYFGSVNATNAVGFASTNWFFGSTSLTNTAYTAYQVLTNQITQIAGGTTYPSNTWNQATITNGLPNFSFWTGNSNGVALVSVQVSNGLVFVKQLAP